MGEEEKRGEEEPAPTEETGAVTAAIGEAKPKSTPPPQEERISRVTRLVVGKGKTSRPSDAEEWVREYYELEAAITDEGEIEVAKSFLEGMIEGWLTSHEVVASIPKLDLAELESLPWKSYRTKEACKEGEAGWVFADHRAPEGAEELIRAIKTSEGNKLELGPYIYQFSGATNQFVSRRPVKKKEK